MKVFSRVSRLVTVSLAVVALAGCQNQAARHADTQNQAKTPEPGSADPSKPRLDPSKVVLTWDNGPMTYGELRKKKEAQYKKLYNKYQADMYNMEQQELENYVISQLAEKKAKAAGKTQDEYLATVAGNPEVSDQELQEFYDKNVKQSGQPFDSIKDRMRQYLQEQKKKEHVRAEFEKMKAEAHVKIDLPPPEIAPVQFDLADRPMRGKPNAKVTLVEFSDFQCPYCSKAVPGVEALLKAYPDDVKFYFLHYPLSFHKSAMPAAIASVCAGKQDKFWEFYDKLFANQQNLQDGFFKSTAKDLGLDESKFVACLEDPATRDRVQKDLDQGNSAGVEGTPSFFINGAPYSQGVPTVEALKPYVERPN